MATVKITVTLPKEQVDEISALVAAGRAPNVSAFTRQAVAGALSDVAGWAETLEEALRQTGGPLTDRERAWADANLTAKRPGTNRSVSSRPAHPAGASGRRRRSGKGKAA